MAPVSFSHDSKRIVYVVIFSFFSFIAIFAVTFRLWARKIQRCRLDLSDYLVIAGLVWSLALAFFTIHSWINWHLGEDVTQLGNPEAIPRLIVIEIKAQLIGEITWAVAVFFVRASIISLYIHVFRLPSFRLACYITHAFNAANFATVVLAACLICRPLSFWWDRSIPGGVCGNHKSLDLYIGIFNLLLDVTVVILPMPVLWGLQLARSKKLVLSGMFGLGIIICAVTLVRIKITADNHGHNAQAVYSLVALFTGLEALLGVVNACLPVMKPVFSKFGSSKPSNWISSVMSGSIQIFVRPSQLGSPWKRPTTRKSIRRSSGFKQQLPTEMHQWPADGKVSNAPIKGVQQSSPPQRADSELGLRSSRPVVPPKSPYYSPARRREQDIERNEESPGIYVQKEWGVARGESQEMDRALLKDQHHNW